MTTIPEGTGSGLQSLLERLVSRNRLPVSALIQLTRRCNLRCRHCFQVERDSAELDSDAWRVVLQRLADAGILFVTFTGGEPTLRPDLIEIIESARGLGFAVKLKTNGLLLDRPLGDALAALALVDVQFSVYAADPVRHDRVTGLSGSHARTIGAARLMRDHGIRVQLNCPLQADTCDAYTDLIAFAVAEGMGWSFDPGIDVREDGCDEPVAFRVSSAQYGVLLADPRLALAAEGRDVGGKRHDRVCRVGRTALAVAPNGDVWPCLSIHERLGSLLEADLKSIWVGNPILEKYSSITWNDLPKCRECEFLAYCSRCHANAMLEDGDLYGPSKLACQGARLRCAAAVARKNQGR